MNTNELEPQSAASVHHTSLQPADERTWPVSAWLDVLRELFPPRGVLLVGAGRGTGDLVQWLRTRKLAFEGVRVQLLEADPQRHRQLEMAVGDECGILGQALIAPAAGAATFHRTSNPAESSLLPLESLQALWPNLRSDETIDVQAATTLDMAAAQFEGPLNWLMLDCLPAGPLLDGGSDLLERLDVALVRVARRLPEKVGAGPTAAAKTLEKAGLRHIYSQPERHPDLTHGLYVRDTARCLRHLESEYEQLRERSRKLSRQLKLANQKAQQAQARAEQISQSHQEITCQLKRAEQEADEAKKQLDNLAREKSELADSPKVPANATSSGNADIDDFLNDVSPFFSGRSVTYVDVGAFIGEIPLKIADHGRIRLREAHLFEPNPESFEQLAKNAKALKVAKLHLYNHALGDDERILTFSAGKSMTKVVDSIEHSADSPGLFQAESKPLDSLRGVFTDHHIDLMKIDVEGFEMEVINGAEAFLREQRVDIIYIEVGFNQSATQQSYFCNIDRRLQDFGYRVFRIYEQRREWILDSPLLRRCNFAYMSTRFAEANPYKATLEITRLRKKVRRLAKEAKN